MLKVVLLQDCIPAKLAQQALWSEILPHVSTHLDQLAYMTLLQVHSMPTEVLKHLPQAPPSNRSRKS